MGTWWKRDFEKIREPRVISWHRPEYVEDLDKHSLPLIGHALGADSMHASDFFLRAVFKDGHPRCVDLQSTMGREVFTGPFQVLERELSNWIEEVKRQRAEGANKPGSDADVR